MQKWSEVIILGKKKKHFEFKKGVVIYPTLRYTALTHSRSSKIFDNALHFLIRKFQPKSQPTLAQSFLSGVSCVLSMTNKKPLR